MLPILKEKFSWYLKQGAEVQKTVGAAEFLSGGVSELGVPCLEEPGHQLFEQLDFHLDGILGPCWVQWVEVNFVGCHEEHLVHHFLEKQDQSAVGAQDQQPACLMEAPENQVVLPSGRTESLETL